MRRDISSSDKPRYASGSGWRSRIDAFSTSFKTGKNVLIVARPTRQQCLLVKLFSISRQEKDQIEIQILLRSRLVSPSLAKTTVDKMPGWLESYTAACC